jgi:phosphoribosylformylglycinamidine cyclo-ligase
VEIRAGSWPVLPVFTLLARLGNVPEMEMYRTFNMGIGMVVIAGVDHAEQIRAHLDARGDAYYDIGQVVQGPGSVSILE